MDLLNPETLKNSSALVEHWKTIIGGVLFIGGAAVGVARWGWIPARWVWSKIRQGRPSTEQFHFVFNDAETLWSSIPETGTEKAGTYVRGLWHVTNDSDRDTHILKARLSRFEAKNSYIFVHGARGRSAGSRVPIVPRRMTQLEANFIYSFEICSPGTSLVADVVFTDNYNREHRVKAVKFQYRGTPV